jgi:phosphotriesterase-related protein
MNTSIIRTVRGDIQAESLGLVLPHEHLFTDLRGPLYPEYAQGNPETVVKVMQPYLEAAYQAGVTALVECSTAGVGRNVSVLKRLAEVTQIHIVAPTGVYRQAYTPAALQNIRAGALADLWIQEMEEGIEGSPVRAGFIKIAMSDDGPTEIEVRNLKAAAATSRVTDAAIASHTIKGTIAVQEMDILESEGLDLERFIWVHANIEPNRTYHLQAAKRGAYVEFDAVGQKGFSQAELVDDTLALIEAGYTDRILLSHDAGWYDPSQPDGQPAGDGIRGFSALVTDFIPLLRDRGLNESMIHRLTAQNPARAFALRGVTDPE